MKFRAIWSIARSVLTESVRKKDFWVVGILGTLIILSAGILGFFGFNGLQSFAKDLALTVLGLFSSIIAIITSCRLIPDEVKNRTLYPLLARPITRFQLLLGKLLGAWIVSSLSFLFLCVLTAVALSTFHVHFEAVMLQYVLCKILGIFLLCCVSFLLSLYLTQSAAVTLSFVLSMGTNMITRALLMSYPTATPAAQWTMKILHAMLPQYALFDLGSRAANSNWGPVPMWVLVALAAYAFVYGSGAFILGWNKFRKQAV